MAVVADLDNKPNEFSIQYWKLTRDIRYVCPMFDITFQTPNPVSFGLDNTSSILYSGTEWSPLTFQEIPSGNNGYIYALQCYPTSALQQVTRFYKTSAELASGLSLVLSSRFSSVNFTIPTKGMNLANLLQTYRKNSLLENWDDPGKSLFIYLESGVLFTSPLSALKNNAVQFDLSVGEYLSTTFSFSDSRNQRDYELGQGVQAKSFWKKQDKLLGRKISVDCSVACLPGISYTGLVTSNWHTDVKNWVCLSSIGSSDYQPATWHSIFSELLI